MTFAKFKDNFLSLCAVFNSIDQGQYLSLENLSSLGFGITK